MSDAYQIPDAVIAQGEHWKPIFTITDATGAVVDLTDSSLAVVLRIRLGTGAATTRTMGTVGEYAWVTDGTDGKVQFVFSPANTAALTAGTYSVELVYTDTDPNPDDKIIAAVGRLYIKAPLTGTI